MKPFEKSLRLLLELHSLTETGEEESTRADEIRDSLDIPWGWGRAEEKELLTADEKEVLSKVSACLQSKTETKDKEK